MVFYKVLHYPHVLLHKKGTAVTRFTDELRDFLKSFTRTMYEFDGGGLAAPQVGIAKRIFVVDFKAALASETFERKEGDFKIFDKNGKEKDVVFPLTFINPEIIEKSRPVSVNWEGCLSVPNADSHRIDRFYDVEIHAQDEYGEKFSVKSSHLYASVCFQHENDHLDGILLPNRWNKKDFTEREVLSDIKNYEDDPATRKKIRKLKIVEAHKIKFDFL